MSTPSRILRLLITCTGVQFGSLRYDQELFKEGVKLSQRTLEAV